MSVALLISPSDKGHVEVSSKQIYYNNENSQNHYNIISL